MPVEGTNFQRVLTLGDSIAAGVGASDSSVINLGVVGAHLNEMNADQVKPGDLVIVSAGLNDVQPGMDMDAYMARLEKYLTDIKAKGGTPVLLGVSSDPAKGTHTKEWNDTVVKMADAQKALADKMGLKFVSTRELPHDASGYHFSAGDYKKIYKSARAAAGAPVPNKTKPVVPGAPVVPPQSGNGEKDDNDDGLVPSTAPAKVSPLLILLAVLSGDKSLIAQIMGSGGITSDGSSLVVPRGDGTVKSLLDAIVSGESGGDYNIMNGGRHMNLTSMTIDQVLALRGTGGSSAAGKYQIMRDTLKGLKKELGLTGNELFDEAMQDRLAVALLERRGLSKFLSGQMSKEQFIDNIRHEWAAVTNKAGVGAYDGYAGNKGKKGSYTQVASALDALVVGSRTQGDLPGTFGVAAAGSSTSSPTGPAPVVKPASV